VAGLDLYHPVHLAGGFGMVIAGGIVSGINQLFGSIGI
jgi:hypothetical protein